jgi:hypothetical protein
MPYIFGATNPHFDNSKNVFIKKDQENYFLKIKTICLEQ